jgi:hypothetical protein
VRYLEDCIAKLQAQRGTQGEGGNEDVDGKLPAPTGPDAFNPARHYEDVNMTDSSVPSPTFTATNNSHSTTRSVQASISPALLAEDSRHRHDSYSSSVSTDNHHRHYSYSHSYGTSSATTSPAFGPQQAGVGHPQGGYAHSSTHSAAGSTLTSPALAPQRDRDLDLDHEATAALLMLNSDRRGQGRPAGDVGRGMSVRDLLTT